MNNNDCYTETYTENWLFRKAGEEVNSPATRYKMPEDPGAWFNFGPLAEEMLKLYLEEILQLNENQPCVCDLAGLYNLADNKKLVHLFAVLNDYRFDEHVGTMRLVELADDVYYYMWEKAGMDEKRKKIAKEILAVNNRDVKEIVKVQEAAIHE